jgi:hypothetical protein
MPFGMPIAPRKITKREALMNYFNKKNVLAAALMFAISASAMGCFYGHDDHGGYRRDGAQYRGDAYGNINHDRDMTIHHNTD